MNQTDLIKRIALSIKNNKGKIVSFIQANGGSIKNNDSDVKIGNELTKVLRKESTHKEFSSILSGSNISNADEPAAGGGLLSGISSAVSSIFGAASGGGATASDTLRLQLINQNIARDKAASSTITIAIIVLLVVMLIIGFLVYKKYNK